MGDERRGAVFALWIVKNFPKAQHILDIAGGKGQVARKLANKKRRVHVIDVDPRFEGRPHPRIFYQSGWFEEDSIIGKRFDLVVGMHPDEATGEIIRYAIKHEIPFSVVPCCIKGRDAQNIGSFADWMKRLSSIAVKAGYSVQQDKLKMRGKNYIIVGKPCR